MSWCGGFPYATIGGRTYTVCYLLKARPQTKYSTTEHGDYVDLVCHGTPSAPSLVKNRGGVSVLSLRCDDLYLRDDRTGK